MRIARVTWKLDGMGIKARKTADGRWVNAIVLILPIRRARDAATRLDRAATSEVEKNVLPSVLSSRSNFVATK
jgi:hypothetical protein